MYPLLCLWHRRQSNNYFVPRVRHHERAAKVRNAARPVSNPRLNTSGKVEVFLAPNSQGGCRVRLGIVGVGWVEVGGEGWREGWGEDGEVEGGGR